MGTVRHIVTVIPGPAQRLLDRFTTAYNPRYNPRHNPCHIGHSSTPQSIHGQSNHQTRKLRHNSQQAHGHSCMLTPHECNLCREMMTIDVMPEFPMLHASNAIWSRMQAGRARTTDLHAVLRGVTAATHALQLPGAGPLMHALLRVATWTLGGCTCDIPADLLERCRWVVGRLEPLLPAVVDEFGAEVSDEEAEAERVREELLQHGLDVEELPVNVDAVVFFFRCAVLRAAVWRGPEGGKAFLDCQRPML